MESRPGDLGVVKSGALCWLVLLASSLAAQEPAADAGPVLYGDGAGRVWKWSAGKKTELTPPSQNLKLGGADSRGLWGWSIEGTPARARFFSMALPKKEVKPGAPVFDKASYPVPDLADREGDRLLLVYAAQTGARWEVWRSGVKTAAAAYDDRIVYAAALGPRDGWLVVGRTADGRPWLNVSGRDYDGPEGWRGRLTVAVWLGEKASPIPFAAGWGAAGNEAPRLLFWEPDGWTEPEKTLEQAETKDSTEGEPEGAVYPVVGAVGENGLTLGGWQGAPGAARPWFWDGKSDVPGGEADGEIQALSLGKGKALVVKHRAPPWFSLEDGTASVPLEGLGEDDHVALSTM